MRNEDRSEPQKEKPLQAKSQRVMTSKELFKGNKEVIIQHFDNQYRLQITKSGKLILNK